MQLFVRAPYCSPCLFSTEASASVSSVCDAYSKYQGLPEGGQRVSGRPVGPS